MKRFSLFAFAAVLGTALLLLGGGTPVIGDTGTVEMKFSQHIGGPSGADLGCNLGTLDTTNSTEANCTSQDDYTLNSDADVNLDIAQTAPIGKPGSSDVATQLGLRFVDNTDSSTKFCGELAGLSSGDVVVSAGSTGDSITLGLPSGVAEFTCEVTLEYFLTPSTLEGDVKAGSYKVDVDLTTSTTI